MLPWTMLPKAVHSPLTTREKEVAGLIALGLTDIEIAKKLSKSRHTVKHQVSHIKVKLGVGNRAGILAWHYSRQKPPLDGLNERGSESGREGKMGQPFKISYERSSPNFWSSNAQMQGIVLHGTGDRVSGVMNSVNYLCSEASGASVNYIIGKGGDIYCIVDPYKLRKAWGNGIWEQPDTSVPWLAQLFKQVSNPNYYTIQIEHEALATDMFENDYASMPLIQKQASQWLVARLMRDFRLPLEANRMIGHSQIMGITRHYCPGVLNLEQYRKEVITMLVNGGGTTEASLPYNARLDPATGAIWFDDTGCLVNYGFRDYFLTIGGNTPLPALTDVASLSAAIIRGVKFFGLPISNELKNGKGFNEQRFERYALEYDGSAPEEWKVRGLLVGTFYQEHI